MTGRRWHTFHVNNSALPRLLYVEDELETAQIAQEVLSEHYQVTHAASAEEGLRLALARPFDVMVFDRRLPGMSGTELVERIRRAGLSTPILLLTALGTVEDRVDGLDGGANDYLVKPFEFAELEARLRALTRDYTRRAEGIPIGSWVFFPHNDTVESPYTGRILLTEKESALLGVLASQPNVAFSRDQLLSAVFDKKDVAGTVDTYVHYLRKKTDRDLVETVRGVGYRLGTPA